MTADALGGSTTAWTTFAQRVPMEVEQTTSRELWNAQQMQPDITSLVRMRWLAGMKTEMRILWHDGDANRTLNIAAPPVEDTKRRELMLKCIEAK